MTVVGEPPAAPADNSEGFSELVRVCCQSWGECWKDLGVELGELMDRLGLEELRFKSEARSGGEKVTVSEGKRKLPVPLYVPW